MCDQQETVETLKAAYVAVPFHESDNGNKSIVVVMNYFSKWAEAKALPKIKKIPTGSAMEIFCDEISS